MMTLLGVILGCLTYLTIYLAWSVIGLKTDLKNALSQIDRVNYNVLRLHGAVESRDDYEFHKILQRGEP